MELIRSFIAIELPDEVRESLRALQAKFKQVGGGAVKWVNPEGIHLTLAFLGNVEAATIPLVTEAMNEAAEGIGTLNLATTDVGAFPNWRRPRVLWVGLTGNVDELAVLQKRLQDRLAPLGFAPEDRPFSPHLTLGRMREPMNPIERHKLGEAMAGIKIDTPQSWISDSVSLMRSVLMPRGAVYTRLAFASLRG